MEENTQAPAPEAQVTPATEEQRNVLLGTISYTNDADYEVFLSKMDVNQALFVLIASANYAQGKGLLNLDEGELVARAIKTIKKNSTAAPSKEAVAQAAAELVSENVDESSDTAQDNS